MVNDSIPSSRFQWLTKNEIDRLDANTIWEDNPKGCILANDLEHLDYHPLAPEKIEIKESMSSDYCKEIANKHNIIVSESSHLN